MALTYHLGQCVCQKPNSNFQIRTLPKDHSQQGKATASHQAAKPKPHCFRLFGEAAHVVTLDKMSVIATDNDRSQSDKSGKFSLLPADSLLIQIRRDPIDLV